MRALAPFLLISSLALAARPGGVPLDVKRGLFTETDIGVFFTLGGNNRYSNAQTYLQLGVGYDVARNLEIGAQFGLGSSAANCFSAQTSGGCALADNFTLGFMNLAVSYLARVAEQFYVSPKLTGGYTKMDPAPAVDSSGKPITSAPNLGVGLGLEYATSLAHFSIGADLLARWVFGPNISGIAVFPRVKYTF